MCEVSMRNRFYTRQLQVAFLVGLLLGITFSVFVYTLVRDPSPWYALECS